MQAVKGFALDELLQLGNWFAYSFCALVCMQCMVQFKLVCIWQAVPNFN